MTEANLKTAIQEAIRTLLAPVPVDCWRFSETNYYQVKEMMTAKLRGADVFCRTPLQLFVRLPSVIVVNLYFTRSDVTVVRIFPRSGYKGASTHSVVI
jgi:hypothetical protein